MRQRWCTCWVILGAAALLCGCAATPEAKAYRWLKCQQGNLALLGNQEDDDLASVYTNALAALCFTHGGDADRARRIFDHYQRQLTRAESGGKAAFAGFHQFSSRATGQPHEDTDRWVGDNAWLLIALNDYRQVTGDGSYDALRGKLAAWFLSLQEDAGGIRSGFRGAKPIEGIVTEANVDCYAALVDHPPQRQKVLKWLKNAAFIAGEQRFRMGTTNGDTALDNVSWVIAALGPDCRTLLPYGEQRFGRIATCAASDVTTAGFADFGDKQRVWFEGTGQMAVAYRVAGDHSKALFYLDQLERAMIPSERFAGTIGLPCTSHDPPWKGGDRKIFVPSVTWYLLAKWSVNPMAGGENPQLAAGGSCADCPE